MVAVVFKTATSTVRIHDEYCERTADRCISHLGRIISESYKRRQLSNSGELHPPAVVAANITKNVLES